MISLEQARAIISAARAHGREHGLKPLTVVVLDAGGHLVAMEREDGSGYGRPQIAQGKAAGALAMGTSSRVLGEMAADRPTFITALSAAWDGKLIPAAGGVLVRDDAGTLLGGAAGRLFDRMLAAIGHSRTSIHLVPLCAKRPMTGRIAPDIEERLGEIARHHIALAGPKRVLLLGNAPSRALLGADVAPARESLRVVNLTGGSKAVTVEAVASFHPRFLLERPAQKADAWRDLQLLIGGLQT